MEGENNKLPICLGLLWTVVGGGVDKTVVLVDNEKKCKRVNLNYDRQTFRKRNSINGLASGYRPKLNFINRCSFFVYWALCRAMWFSCSSR